MSNWLILTATITPSSEARVRLISAPERLRQYQASIASWQQAVSGGPFCLAVVESSGTARADLLKDLPLSRRQGVVTMHVPVPRLVEQRGKGASESYMLDDMVSNLSTRWSETIYKVTGRLFVKNHSRCVVPLRPQEAVVRMTINRMVADTRFIGATFGVWEDVLRGMSDDIDERVGLYIENVVAGRLAMASALRKIGLSRFKVRPDFSGASASTLSQYDRSIGGGLTGIYRPIESVLWRIAGRKQL